MARALLVRGMLAGVLAGLVALVFAAAFGEPQVAAAIRVEEAHAAAGEAGAEPVSRLVQSTVGLGLAIIVFGAAVGGVFGLAFGFLYGRLGASGARATGARATALGVAATGFVAGSLVPFLKYPANPPGVESSLGMRERTALYFLVLLIAVLVAIGALIAGRSLVARWGAWNGAIAASLGFVVIVTVIGAVLPGAPSQGEGFPPELLWRFRVASLGTQAALWVALGLVFGALTERAERRDAAAARPLEPVG
jgi:putative cobalt transporter subunit CbtA